MIHGIPVHPAGSAVHASAISDAVRRVDVVQISPDVARYLVHCLGRLADDLVRQNGCAPEALVAVQHALAEACADSRTREGDVISALTVPDSDRDVLMDTKEAAAVLGIRPTTVTLHCRSGLLGQKVGREWVIRLDELKEFQRARSEHEGEVA
jgi:Helix-turn-helix domain